jgi:hypothetical protein
MDVEATPRFLTFTPVLNQNMSGGMRSGLTSAVAANQAMEMERQMSHSGDAGKCDLFSPRTHIPYNLRKLDGRKRTFPFIRMVMAGCTSPLQKPPIQCLIQAAYRHDLDLTDLDGEDGHATYVHDGRG